MVKEDPSPYIRASEEMINKPAICSISNKEMELSNGELVYLTEDFQPICDEHVDQARYVASVQRATGTPWNGIHPETGDLQSLQSTTWWSLMDVKLIQLD